MRLKSAPAPCGSTVVSASCPRPGHTAGRVVRGRVQRRGGRQRQRCCCCAGSPPSCRAGPGQCYPRRRPPALDDLRAAPKAAETAAAGTTTEPTQPGGGGGAAAGSLDAATVTAGARTSTTSTGGHGQDRYGGDGRRDRKPEDPGCGSHGAGSSPRQPYRSSAAPRLACAVPAVGACREPAVVLPSHPTQYSSLAVCGS